MLSGWQGREAIVSYAMQQIHHVPSPWFTRWARWHCPDLSKKSDENRIFLCPHQMVPRLPRTSQVNRWKGDKHTQGVSSLPPWIVRNADVGCKSAKIFSDMSCSLNLHPDTWYVWFLTIEAHWVWTKHLPAVFSQLLLLAVCNYTTWTLTAKPKGRGMIQMTPAKNLGDREIWISSQFGTNEVRRNKEKPVAMGGLKQAAWKHRNAAYPYEVLSKSKPRIWMSSFSKNAPSHVCHISAGVSFRSSSAWGQMLSESKSGKQVGERMLALWIVECSNVATQHKRPCFVDPGWTKLQEMEDLIWPQSILWTH